jgi:hypothetical protein
VSYQATVYRVLIASPSDVPDERHIIPEVIHGWNDLHSVDMAVVLLPVKWETHATPEMGERPQAIINKQIVEECDILLGVFWTKLGTPTGKAESGTVEEIKEFRDRGKRVLLYFSSKPVDLDSVDLDQYNRLKAFKQECFENGIVFPYTSSDELRGLLHRHLLDTVRRLKRPEESVDAATAPPPTSILVPGVMMFLSDYERFHRRLASEWAAERDSGPRNIDDGKRILARAGEALLDFRAQPVVDAHPELAAALDTILRDIRALERHRLSADGGNSFRAFWRAGDEVTKNIGHIPEFLRQIGMTIEIPQSQTLPSLEGN